MYSKNLRRTLSAAVILSTLCLATPAAHAWPLSGSRGARFQEWDILSSLWAFFTGMLKDTTDTGMTIDPNGKPTGNGSKAGMTIDPHGTPIPSGSNPGGSEGDAGMTIDPHG